MSLCVIVIFGSLFSYTDIKRHIIPNSYLLVMSLVIACSILFAKDWWHHLFVGFYIIVGLICFQWLTAGVVGMGDIKYLALLGFLTGSMEIFLKGLQYSLLLSSLFAILIFIHGSSIKACVPLAPPISLGFLLALIL